MIKKLAITITTAAILAGCVNSQTTSVNINQPQNTSAPSTSDNTSFSSKSSGDVDQDIKDIESAIDSLDVDEDFPTFDENSI